MKCRKHNKFIKAINVVGDSGRSVGTSGIQPIGIWCNAPRFLNVDRDIPGGFGYFKTFTNFSYVVRCDEEMLGELHTLLQRDIYEC